MGQTKSLALKSKKSSMRNKVRKNKRSNSRLNVNDNSGLKTPESDLSGSNAGQSMELVIKN